jgi:hypothetical protein
LYDFETRAELRDHTTLTGTTTITPADVTIAASSEVTLVSAAGGVAWSGRLGFGAAVDVGIINNTVRADIAHDSEIETTGNVEITAAGSESVISVGASLAVGTKSFGIAGSGASQTITSDVQAFIDHDVTVTTDANLLIDATDTLHLIAVGGAGAFGKTAGFGASVGNGNIRQTSNAYIAGSNNVIVAKGNDAAISTPDGSLTGNGIIIHASGEEQLYVFGAAGAGAQKVAFAGSPAVVLVTNDVEAFIGQGAAVNQGISDLNAAMAVQILASQITNIFDIGGSVAAALSVGQGGGGTAAAIGLGAVVNLVTNTVLAHITGATVDAAHGVSVQANESTTIWGLAVGGAVAASAGSSNGAGGGGGSGVGLAGAGVGNTIENTVHAYIASSDVSGGAAGDVNVIAGDTSTITANAGGIGVGVGVGSGGSGVGASLGVAIAINDIENDVQAYVDSSTVSSGGGVLVAATETATIAALTIGGAVAVGASGGGGSGVGVAAAGAGSGNTVKNRVRAYLSRTKGGATRVTAGNGNVNVTALDTSTVTANGGGVGVGIGVASAGNGVGVTVGISAAANDVENDVWAYIDNATVSATAGNVAVSAKETATIKALTIGGAVAVGASGGGNGVGIGGAGAGSGNTVKNSVLAYIQANSTITTTASGDVLIQATDTSAITADGGGVGIAVGAASGNGVGVSLGVAFADNDIENTVKAYIDSSKVTSAGAVTLAASETATISALTIGGAVAVGAGGGNGVGVAVAGAGSSNTVKNDVEAYIKNSNDSVSANIQGVTAQAGAVSLTATDTSTVTANGGGVGVAVGGGGGNGVGVTVGISVAINDIENKVWAYIDNSTVTAAGGVSASATEGGTITALTIGGAVAVGGGGRRWRGRRRRGRGGQRFHQHHQEHRSGLCSQQQQRHCQRRGDRAQCQGHLHDHRERRWRRDRRGRRRHGWRRRRRGLCGRHQRRREHRPGLCRQFDPRRHGS